MDMTSTAPIGVFDSGLGGISVVRQIVQDMPHERVLYFGDSANAPYGTKTPQEVRRLSFDIMERFMSQGVKAVVIACNTATSAAVNALRDHYDIPIIGTVEPACRRAMTMTQTGRVGVIGTAATIRSGAYEKYLHKKDGTLDLFTAGVSAVRAAGRERPRAPRRCGHRNDREGISHAAEGRRCGYAHPRLHALSGCSRRSSATLWVRM